LGELYAYGSKVTSVFQLIGMLEDDITKSIAWALCNCPVFLKKIIDEVLNIYIDPSKVRIKYQESEKDKGRTDLELTDDLFYVIIEAKKGWILPGKDQLSLYSQRRSLVQSSAKHKVIMSMSECSDTYANSYLPIKQANGIPIMHLPWKRIYELAENSISESNNLQKNLLRELMKYLGGLMTMQTQESNWVFVVSLGTSKPEDCDLTWIEIVQNNMKYFHPLGGNGWPKEPPNYIAFRYYGQLQSIHHIEDYVVTKKLHDEIPEMPDKVEGYDFFVYKLGPAIVPTKVVKTGNIYASGRKWAMLDTLLTADTIADACNISKARME
jgi:hypothetical protein